MKNFSHKKKFYLKDLVYLEGEIWKESKIDSKKVKLKLAEDLQRMFLIELCIVDATLLIWMTELNTKIHYCQNLILT